MEEKKEILSIKDMLNVEAGKLEELPESEVKVEKFSELLGKDVYVKVRGIKSRRYEKLVTPAVENSAKNYDAKVHVAAEAIVEPDMHDKELQKHFGARTPHELVEILFPGEDLTRIFVETGRLSGFIKQDGEESDLEDEAKN